MKKEKPLPPEVKQLKINNPFKCTKGTFIYKPKERESDRAITVMKAREI